MVLKPGTLEADSCGRGIQAVLVQGHRAILLLKENAGAFLSAGVHRRKPSIFPQSSSVPAVQFALSCSKPMNVGSQYR